MASVARMHPMSDCAGNKPKIGFRGTPLLCNDLSPGKIYLCGLPQSKVVCFILHVGLLMRSLHGCVCNQDVNNIRLSSVALISGKCLIFGCDTVCLLMTQNVMCH